MNLPARVGEQLLHRSRTIAVAESCTGGLVGARLTEVPGSSSYFVGGAIAYANAVKVAVLGVPELLLEEHGAVSEPVALAMAEGALSAFGADLAVATTGIAGPSGGSPEKPVGTVYIALASREGECRCRRHQFEGDRSSVRCHTVDAALRMVLEYLGETDC